MVNETVWTHMANSLTPDSAARGMVLEQMPLHASQKRISWSYEPVTRMTDMSVRAAAAADLEDEDCTGMVIETVEERKAPRSELGHGLT